MTASHQTKIGRRESKPNQSLSVVHLSRGVAVTDSLVIAREFRRRHDNVLQSLDSLLANGIISRLDSKARDYLDERGKSQRMIELSERGALIAMPFIGGRNSRCGQARLVDAFLSLRDANTMPSGERKALRQTAADNYSVVSEYLQMTRQADGKTTQSHHYSNEARLINYALTGQFKSVDRDSLSSKDMRVLCRLEIQDAVLLKLSKSYEERKADLIGYALLQRARHGGRLLS